MNLYPRLSIQSIICLSLDVGDISGSYFPELILWLCTNFHIVFNHLFVTRFSYVAKFSVIIFFLVPNSSYDFY